MDVWEQLAAFIEKFFVATDPAGDWSAVLAQLGPVPACEPFVRATGETTLHTLAAPWAPIRLPAEYFDITAHERSEDDPRRIWQRQDGTMLRLEPLPRGIPLARLFDVAVNEEATAAGMQYEGRCARIFADCAVIIDRWGVTLFGEYGFTSTALVLARTGAKLFFMATAGSVADRDALFAAVVEMAEAGLVAPPAPAHTGGPSLTLRLHASFGGGLHVAPQFEERTPRDDSHADKEARAAHAQFELAHLQQMWWFPKEVAPELLARHEEELVEYEEDWRVFRLLEVEGMDQGGRSSKLPLVIANEGDAAATDVEVTLVFPPELVPGTIATLINTRPERPEPPQWLDQRAFGQRRRRPMPRTVIVGDLEAAARELGWTRWSVLPDGSTSVSYRVARVAAGTHPTLTDIYYMFRMWEDIRAVTVACELRAAGIDPIRSEIRIEPTIRTLVQREAEYAAWKVEHDAEELRTRQAAIAATVARGERPVDYLLGAGTQRYEAQPLSRPRPRAAADIGAEVERRLDYEWPSVARLRDEGRLAPGLSEELLHRYERERIECAGDWFAWSLISAQLADRDRRTLDVSHWLRNATGVTLPKVRARVRFPAHVVPHTYDTFAQSPNTPEPPVALAAGAESTPPRARFEARPREPRPTDGYPDRIERRPDGTTVMDMERLAPRDGSAQLPPLLVTFARWEDVGPFEIEYELTADEMPPVRGAARVIVARAADDA